MFPRRFAFAAAGCLGLLGQPWQPQVQSARIASANPVPERSAIQVRIVNLGDRPITAYMLLFSRKAADGSMIPCGGRGLDMIDWSDPMPGTGLYVHMRRNWIAPKGGEASLDGYPTCPGGKAGETARLDGIQVELGSIVFDDGRGEGVAQHLESTLRSRQRVRDERVKWIGRFSALRDAPDLGSAARSLYQDIVDAAHAAEIRPADAARQGMAKPARDELQRLALELTQWAERGEPLSKSNMVQWRLTDLEQRTARLVRGCGSFDVDLSR